MSSEIGDGSCFSDGVPATKVRHLIVKLILNEYRKEWLECKSRDSGMTEGNCWNMCREWSHHF
jgi:hypothetical protein